MSRPALAYATTFPKAFYQEQYFLVCNDSCDQKDAKRGKDQLEQQNVYYWLTQFYSLAKKRFDLSVEKRVKVMVDRNVKDPGTSKKMKNNAFFNPADGSLSFLPAKNSLLAKIFGEGKINRSGFDPSVVAHEAGHSLFHVLFPNAVNPEIDGFNEGFADYMANILLDDAKVGVVMLRGKALRDSESLTDSSGAMKSYVPGQEAHDMGERFATALWLSRGQVSDKEDFDHLVISAVKDVAVNPFATGHAFKQAFLKRIEYTYDALTSQKIKAFWELIVPGVDRVVKDTSFIKLKNPTNTFLGLKVENKFSEAAMRDLGITDSVLRFTFIRTQKTRDGFDANLVSINRDNMITPYWIVIDPSRKNAIGAWRLDGTQADASDAENLKTLVKSTLERDSTVEGFLQQAKLLIEVIQAEGDGAYAYKVLAKHTNSDRQIINGQYLDATTIKVDLKRKILGRLGGVPNIKSAQLKTTKALKLPASWPSTDEGSAIGVMLKLEDGTVISTTLEMVNI
jgi:hypothetical protein